MKIPLIHDVRGATAIEYAVIAGLLGLGIVGSLVTTRGSLKGTFGTASSQLESSSSQSASRSASPRAPYWEARTLVSKSLSGTTTRYVYSDGQIVDVYRQYGQDGKYTTWLMISRETNGFATHQEEFATGDNGAAQRFSIFDYYANSTQRSSTTLGYPEQNWSATTYTFSPSGGPATSICNACSTFADTKIKSFIDDTQYFNDLTGPKP